MTAVKMQTAMLDAMVKASAGKGDSLMESLNASKKESSFSNIMAMQSKSVDNSYLKDNKAMVKGSELELNRLEGINTTKTSSNGSEKTQTLNNVKEEVVNTYEQPKTEEVDSLDNEQNEEELIGEMEKILQKFLLELQKLLGLNEEQLAKLMETSGLTTNDLLNPDNLQNLILTHFQAGSVTDALVNESLANALKDGMKAYSEFLDQLSQLTDEAGNNLTPEALHTMLLEIGNKGLGQQTIKEDKAPQPSEMGEVVDINGEKELTILVEKDASTSQYQTGEDGLKGRDSKTAVSKQVDTKTDFVDYFASKVNQVGMDGIGNTAEPVSFRTIVTQIVNQIKVNISQTETSMQLLLNPENLGHVKLLVAQKEGVLTAQFTVQNQVTKEALESSLHILKQSFEEQGVKVAEVEVTIGNYSDGFNQEDDSKQAEKQGSSNRKRSVRELDFTEDVQETLVQQTDRVNYNGTVEYTA